MKEVKSNLVIRDSTVVIRPEGLYMIEECV